MLYRPHKRELGGSTNEKTCNAIVNQLGGITMPEGSVDATILLATSWQALKRAKNGDERTMLCNCTVVVVFAAFFIEANLNHIVEEMGKTNEMLQFLGNRNAGLQHKLAWFYNNFVA